MSAHPPCVFCQQPLNTCPPGGIGYINRYDDAGRWAGYAYHAGLGQCLKALQAAGWRPPESPESALDAH